MAHRKQTVRIESILGGQSPSVLFATPDQFHTSFGIDPGLPITNSRGVASGALRPTSSLNLNNAPAPLTRAPQWLVTNPKDANVYIYDVVGSAFTVADGFTAGSITALADGGTLSSSSGNGCEYYDNYIYFAKNTDIARYGPLNGVPAFTGSYWVTTLSNTSLVNTTYPTENLTALSYPNHVLHRHSDGKLYIADVYDNQGRLHYIQTKGVTTEGDTNNSSTVNAIIFAVGLWPTALESYGTNLAIALYEGTGGSSAGPKRTPAKLAFWNTVDASVNQLLFVEFPDQIITALKNINGVLYIVSGNVQTAGFRVSRYVGGYTVEEVFYSEEGSPCFGGAIDGNGNRLLLGTYKDLYSVTTGGCVYSIGLQKAGIGKGIFNIMAVPNGTGTSNVTAMKLADNNNFSFPSPLVAWSDGTSGSSNNGLNFPDNSNYGSPASSWVSQIYRVGKPFKIESISIPLLRAAPVSTNTNVRIYTDNGLQIGDAGTLLSPINSTTFSVTNQRLAYFHTANIRGYHNFQISIQFSATALAPIGFPIEIEYTTDEEGFVL